MRNPLTSVRGYAELYRQGASRDTDLLMTRIENESRRMGVLVEDLLMPARLDAQRPLAQKPVDLLALAALILGLVSFFAFRDSFYANAHYYAACALFACIVVDDEIVGWVDYDNDREWLAAGEVNVGYNVFAACRGRGYATRAVELLLRHLADAEVHTATLLIDPANERSLALAARLAFGAAGQMDGQQYFKRTLAR